MISNKRLLPLLDQIETLAEIFPQDESFQLRSVSNRHVGQNGLLWFAHDERDPDTFHSEIIAIAILQEGR